jgi:tRNA uridine 5-carboxymethylaminomethyl modification enzyme
MGRRRYRLLLRADNADLRLTLKGFEAAPTLVSQARVELVRRKRAMVDEGAKRLRELVLKPNEWMQLGVKVKEDGVRRSAMDILGYPDVDLAALERMLPQLGAQLAFLSPQARHSLEIESQYSAVLDRQRAEIERVRRDENLAIPVVGLELRPVRPRGLTRAPQDLDFHALPSLSAEEKEKLSTMRPRTIGDVRWRAGRAHSVCSLSRRAQANRISGITPVGLLVLYAHIKKARRSALAA